MAPVAVLYGSETGNAADYAQYLARRLRYCSLEPTVLSLDLFPLKQLAETRFLIVICLTTGQGAIPRNGQRFFRFLRRKKLPADLLSHVSLALFGLGDLLYPQYNFAIKKIHTRLLQLGCSDLCARGEGDDLDPQGIDAYFAEWMGQLEEALFAHFPNLARLDDEVLLPPVYPVEPAAATREIDDLLLAFARLGLSAEPTAKEHPHLHRAGLTGRIRQNKRVTADDHFQDVRHVTIEADTDLQYAPGDCIGLYPQNADEDVELFLQAQPHLLPYADVLLTVPACPEVEGGLIPPETRTLRNLLKHHIDLSAVPLRSFFAAAFHFVDASTEDGARERAKLRDFTKLDEAEDLYNYANRPRRLVLETVAEFQNNLRIPLQYLVDVFPLIKVRLFLIASRPSARSVELVVAIVEYKTILRRLRRGLCTRWLKSLEPGDRLLFSVHPLNLSFGSPLNPALIMVGPGTGIAPMKALVEARGGDADMHLFYGFRDPQKDMLFRDLWASTPRLTLYTAASRDPGHARRYVQDVLFEARDTLVPLLLTGAVFYLCGSSGKMPTQVRLTLVEMLQGHVADPEQYLVDMESSGQYIQETW